MSQFGRNNPYNPNVGSGGGYLPGSPFGSASGSPGGGVGERTDATQSLRPVTIGQLCRATQAHADAEWRIDGVDLGQVTLVGQVISIQSQTTNSVYWLDDGSGRIEARHWMDASNEEENEKWSGIAENTYVRVTGALKTFGNKRYINAAHIRPSKDPHELYFHILEAMTVSLIFERGPPSASSSGVDGGVVGHAGPSAYASRPTAGAAKDQYAHLSPIQRQILDVIRDNAGKGEGVHVAVIARKIGGEPHAISTAIDTLMDEGLVFTTSDDSHVDITQP